MNRLKGISVFTVENPQKGTSKASDILNKNTDGKTALFLSGGLTPRLLYKLLTKEKKLSVGAVGMVDERYGDPYHKNSNEKMLKDSGLLNYFKNKNIPFYGILRSNQDLENTALRYDKVVENLFAKFERKISILGIGEDGHTAGLPLRRVQSSGFKVQSYVESVSNFPGEFKERITLTFKALAQIDLLIILVFGSDKKKALKMMFEEGLVEQIPARFYVKPEISSKTLLITDQKI